MGVWDVEEDSWNEIDPAAPVVWSGSEPAFRLMRRKDERSGMAALHGRDLVAVGFVFDDGRIAIYNALDENGLEPTPPDSGHRIHRL